MIGIKSGPNEKCGWLHHCIEPYILWLQPTSTTALTSKGNSRLNPVLRVVDGLAMD